MIGAHSGYVRSNAATEERQISRGLTWATVAVTGVAMAFGAVSASTFPAGTLLAGAFILGWTQLGST
jgi:hypothetical protein